MYIDDPDLVPATARRSRDAQLQRIEGRFVGILDVRVELREADRGRG